MPDDPENSLHGDPFKQLQILTNELCLLTRWIYFQTWVSNTSYVPTKSTKNKIQLLLQYTWLITSWFLKGEDLQKPTSWSGCTGNELCELLERGEYTGDTQIKRSLVKQKCLNMHAFDGIASMSSKLKLRTFSYLKLRVVACNVGFVVPGGRLGEEKNLFCSAVVFREEQLCLFQSV